jgi:uncharacterized membrane protein YkoI
MRGGCHRSLSAWLAAGSLALALALAPSAHGEREEGAARERGESAERVREEVQAGRFVSLTSILEWLERRYFGHVIEVELEPAEDGEPPSYEIEWLTPQNHVIEFEFDARTGELLEVEGRGLDEARRP